MSLEQLLLIGIAIGLVGIGVVLVYGRFRAPSKTRDPLIPAPPPGIDTTDESAEEAVRKLSETVGALKRLAELKDDEVTRDETFRSAQKTGWRPVSSIEATSGLSPRRRATDRPGDSFRPVTSPAPMVTEVSQVRIDASTKMDTYSAAELRLRIGRAFTPAAPVARRDLFAGRIVQLETLVDVAFEQGQHAIIYGERGVGKTSLARILSLIFEGDEYKVAVRVNCDATDDFTSVWRKVLDELDMVVGSEGAARTAIDTMLAKEVVTPNDVRRVLHQVATERECVILIDEFDTMTNQEVTRLFADTIKTLSDQSIPTTLIIIGVADSLDELLAEHGSINRALVNIHMPRMSVPELKDIVRRGLQLLTMDIEPEALGLIAEMSQGFPHFTHLISQAATRAAVDGERPLVTMEDVEAGIKKVSDRVEAWIQEAYERATASKQGAMYPEVLLAAALAPNDAKGFFAAADVRTPLSSVLGKKTDIPSFSRQLNALTEVERGPVLVKAGSERKYRYRFIEPHMEPYVLMRSLSAGLLDRSILVSEGPAASDPSAPRPAASARQRTTSKPHTRK